MKFEIAGAEPRMPEALGGIDSLRGGRWLAASATLHRNPLLRCLTSDLGCSWDWNRGLSASGREVVRVGWGYRPSGEWARSGGEGGFVLFEDGFVRSLKPGNGRGATYSLVADRQGIYYDPSGRSDLVERLRRRSERGGGAGLDGDLARFLELGISKYNWFGAEFREGALDAAMPETGVLVVDQARGDTSLEAGKIGVREFEELVARALAENPGKPVYVRTHPDRVFRARRSCIPEACLSWPRVRVVGADLSPKQVLSRVEKVYVMSSLFGLEALLHGKEVIHGGLGFYGGWGLTRDLRELPGRSGVLTREGLFDVAYREYCLWFDPDTGERCELGRILDHLELQKAMFRKNAHT